MKNLLVFISSTFKDMEDTRSCLVNGVFKELEQYAADRGVRLGVIDLVWGIPDSRPGTQAEIIRRCLDLVDEAKPYFLGLIGNRYGWTPAPETLDALAQGRERPEDGTSVTELEVYRYFAPPPGTDAGPSGLFILKNGGEDDSSRLPRLREAIRAHAGAQVLDVQEISPTNTEMLAGIRRFFEDRIDDLAEAAPRERRFPAQMVGRLMSRQLQVNNACERLCLEDGDGNARRIVLVDADDDLARVSFIDEVCRQWAAANPGGTYEQVHLGAEGILSYKGLIEFLDRIGALAEEPLESPRLVAIDGFEDMPMWRAPEDMFIEGKYWIFGHIWKAERNGVRWLVGADFSKRPALLSGLESKGWLPGCELVRLDTAEGTDEEFVDRYFRAFGKEAAPAHSGMILGTVRQLRLSPTETLLLCDRIRRISRINRQQDVLSQDEFMGAQIGAILPASREQLYSATVAELREQFGDRAQVAERALGLVCASVYGIGLADLQDPEFADGTEPMSTCEWSLFRAILGPLLVGTVRRVRIADDEARRLVGEALGAPVVQAARYQLLEQLFRKVASLRNLVELVDLDSALTNELPELINRVGWDSPHAAQFFDPAIFLSWAIYDTSLLAYQFQVLVESALPAEAMDDPVFANDPWQGIDRLCALVAATDFSSEDGRRLVDAMDHALRDMDLYPGSVEYRDDAFGARALACIYGGMRARVLMRTMVEGRPDGHECTRALSSAIQWRNRLMSMDDAPAAAIERAWQEIAACLLALVDDCEDCNWQHVRTLLPAIRNLPDAQVPPALGQLVEKIHELCVAQANLGADLVPDASTTARLRDWLEAVTGVAAQPGQGLRVLCGELPVRVAAQEP